jgi:prepilin-type processing-associated H-X9-DG protein
LLTCLDYKTGKVMWEDRKPGKGSIAFADGHLYYRNEGGPIVLVEANPERYVEKGRFNQPERSKARAWPHPVIANGKLYIRDQDLLLCYDVKEKTGE